MADRPYQKLIVWQEAHRLCLWVYKLTKKLPKDERFELVKQMRRSAYGVPMNIAEGNAKRSRPDQKKFIEIAAGSLEELHYQCLLSKDLHYISVEDFSRSVEHIQRVSFLLMKLRTSLL